MKFPWFRRISIFFLPVNMIGWIILAAAIAFAVYLFIHIDGRSHSVSDTLRPFFLWLIIIFIAYSSLAWLTSGKT